MSDYDRSPYAEIVVGEEFHEVLAAECAPEPLVELETLCGGNQTALADREKETEGLLR